MIEGKSVLAIIPARGGSKGIPRKNIIELGGKPLITWTMEAAAQCPSIDRLILSSDDAEIIAVAKSLGIEVPFVRPADLAADQSSGTAPVVHALESLAQSYDYVVLLQPTSPFRSSDDIESCLHLCQATGAPACVSVTEAASHPYLTYRIEADSRMRPFVDEAVATRRQDMPDAYVLNGAVYVARVDWFLEHQTFLAEETVAFVMPAERSLDIDTQFDLRIARALAAG